MININKRKMKKRYRDAKKWRLKEAMDYYLHDNEGAKRKKREIITVRQDGVLKIRDFQT